MQCGVDDVKLPTSALASHEIRPKEKKTKGKRKRKLSEEKQRRRRPKKKQIKKTKQNPPLSKKKKRRDRNKIKQMTIALASYWLVTEFQRLYRTLLGFTEFFLHRFTELAVSFSNSSHLTVFFYLVLPKCGKVPFDLSGFYWVSMDFT